MDELYVRSRRALLDALEALAEHGDGVVLIGAHAVYVYTGETDVPIVTRTKDSDLALDPALLRPHPLLEDAMTNAGFHRNLEGGQPGEWLSAWGASTTYPLLLHLYKQVDAGRATTEQVERCLEAIESFIVRRYLAAIPTNVLNRLFIQLIGALPQGEPVDIALRRELSRDGRWPDNGEVREGIATVPYYSHGRAHQQRLVLQCLESFLRTEVDLDFDSADLSIEHIMPQTLSPEWKAELATGGQEPQEIFDRLGHTLGNLTLTAWNSKLSNQLFERKQEILSDSELKLNESLVNAVKWGTDEIEARAHALADTACALWIEPIPGVVTPHAGFDWGRVDAVVNALPAGTWTSYGDLAELVGTAAQPTASHVAKDPTLKHAYRVLSGDGSISFNFQWHDQGDTRDPVEVLIGEGIEFDEQNRASQAQRLGPADLEALLERERTPLA